MQCNVQCVVRRSVMDPGGHSAATHRVAGGGLSAVQLRGVGGAALQVDLLDAQDLLELPPWDAGLAHRRGAGICVYIVPDGVGRLLRIVDGGSERGLLQVADVTAVVEEVTLMMQGALTPPDPARPQMLFAQHLSANECGSSEFASPTMRGE